VLQPHPDPHDRDDLPSWVAVAVAPARPRLALLGSGKKIFFAAPTSRKAPTTTGALTALFVNERVAVRSSNRNSLPQDEAHPAICSDLTPVIFSLRIVEVLYAVLLQRSKTLREEVIYPRYSDYT
jgi:hypothetical protein